MSGNTDGVVIDEPQLAGPATEAQYFDEFAERYQEILDRNLSVVGETALVFTRRRMEYLRRRLPVLPTRVMDFGCGIGLAIPHLLEAFPGSQVVGVDISPESVRVARERNRHERVHVTEPAWLDARDFDLVYSSGVFHHIPRGERPETLAFIHRAMRPGGVIAIAEHNPWNPATRYLVRTCPFDEDVQLLRPKETVAMLAAAGFRVLSRDFVGFFPGKLRALQWMERGLVRVPIGAQYVTLARREA